MGSTQGLRSAPGHGRIWWIGDFNHLWYEVLHHGSRFSGLCFCSDTRFGSHVKSTYFDVGVSGLRKNSSQSIYSSQYSTFLPQRLPFLKREDCQFHHVLKRKNYWTFNQLVSGILFFGHYIVDKMEPTNLLLVQFLPSCLLLIYKIYISSIIVLLTSGRSPSAYVFLDV